MAEVAIPRDFGPPSAPNWFGTWARVTGEPELTVIGSAPDRNQPTGVVLLAAALAGRSLDGLPTRWGAAGPRLEPPAIVDLRTARSVAVAAEQELESTQPQLSPSILRMARFVTEELGANVVQHSGRPASGFGICHVDGARKRLEITFADRGIGFRRSLERNPELGGRIADDAEAL